MLTSHTMTTINVAFSRSDFMASNVSQASWHFSSLFEAMFHLHHWLWVCGYDVWVYPWWFVYSRLFHHQLPYAPKSTNFRMQISHFLTSLYRCLTCKRSSYLILPLVSSFLCKCTNFVCKCLNEGNWHLVIMGISWWTFWWRVKAWEWEQLVVSLT